MVDSSSEPIVRGSEVVLPFVIKVEDGVVSLTGGTLTAEIWWRVEKQMELTVDDGQIEIYDEYPTYSEEDDFQNPHGVVRLVEEVTQTFPLGQVSGLRFKFVDALEVTSFTDFLPLEGLL